mmetsp:Transcript_3575/g.7681  ORF Transcript_3575/g.7681 Transcript_3575/m.7681 type:complete len:123 (+) Transcript_3575:267-635(+)
MYDLTLHDSFDALKDWLDEVRQNSNSDVLIFLVGNMLDIEEEREVSSDEAKAFATANHLDGVYEGSAKTSANVTEVFTKIAEVLYDKLDERERHTTDATPKPTTPVNLGAAPTKVQGKKKCC